MKKVVSLALFGEGDEYARYLPSFLRAHLNVFPQSEGWQLRVHVDRVGNSGRRGFGIIADTFGLIRLYEMGESNFTKSMLWRLAPLFDEDVSHVFCRDLDSLPMPRDRRCCDEFLVSGTAAHVIHDHRHHERMMGGLCGFDAAALRRITGWKSLDDVYKFAGNVDWQKKGTDQMVLNKMLVHFGQDLTLLEHRYSGWYDGPGKHAARDGGQYPCAAWSRPVPDVGAPGRTPELTAQADLLAPHLGSAGYDTEAAVRFWDEWGDPEIARNVHTREQK